MLFNFFLRIPLKTFSQLSRLLPHGNSRYGALESLRGLAAMMVVVHHFTNWILHQTIPGSLSSDFQMLTKHFGGFGVELFFAISGYLIPSLISSQKLPYERYLLRRIRRIYPLAVVAITLECAALLIDAKPVITDPITGHPWIDLLLNFLLVPGVYPVTPIYHVTWTLSYEMLFYMTCPTLMWILDRISSTATIRILVVIALIPIVRLLSPYHSEASFFLIGMCVFESSRAVDATHSNRILLNFLCLTVVPIIFAAMVLNGSGWVKPWWTGESGFYAWVVVKGFAFFCLLAACTKFGGAFSRLLSGGIFLIVGTTSYSLYLLHIFVVAMTFTVFGRFHLNPIYTNAEFFLLLSWTVFASVICAFLGFIFIERPMSLDGRWPWSSKIQSQYA